jgi:phosphoglycerol transferase MdoB-like AlkP superfamily enzyme
MKRRLIALGLYSVFWLIFFIIARLLFIISQYSVAIQNSFGELFATFWNGSKLDISTTGYYLLIPVLFAIPGVLTTGSWYKYFISWYTFIMITFSSMIVVSDAILYSYWGFRMDYTPLFYLKTPAEAMASITTIQIILYVLAIILLSALFIFIYKKYFDRLFDKLERVKYRLLSILFMLILCGALIIPIRGGLGVAPLNSGAVYFSHKMFLNQTAINSIWNVGTSFVNKNPEKNPYEFGNLAQEIALVDSLVVKRGNPDNILNTNRPNVIIIILESFSGYLIGPLGGDSLTTPNFNRYTKEGILFSNFYASGTRTDKALPAILDGYPAQPVQSIIKDPKKSQSLPSLVKILIDEGYSSAFWYGGEINFANFNSFVIGSGFKSIITKSSFSSENYNADWGVHDHLLFKALEDSMKTVTEPFLKVVLTLSSHDPFDVPMETVFKGDDLLNKYRNSIFYTDKSLGSFLDWAKEKDWWKRTLIVMVADHGARLDDMPVFAPSVFKIPMLWVGGALTQKGIEVKKFGSQVDIPVTLLGQIGIKGSFQFGKDLLSENSNSFAFYTFNEGFGFFNDSSAVAYDHKMKDFVIREGRNTQYAEKAGKSFLQVLFNDYLKR